jgi:hypothetical protein
VRRSETATECRVEIDATCAQVFDTVHNYQIRLNWDTLLSSAAIIDGSTGAGLGVRTLCVGRGAVSGFGMETVYISFDRPKVAAVRMTRGPWFVKDFAASIRHEAGAGNGGIDRSFIVYKFRIMARPRWLRPVLDPILHAVFRRETMKRLKSLKRYMERA